MSVTRAFLPSRTSCPRTQVFQQRQRTLASLVRQACRSLKVGHHRHGVSRQNGSRWQQDDAEQQRQRNHETCNWVVKQHETTSSFAEFYPAESDGR